MNYLIRNIIIFGFFLVTTSMLAQKGVGINTSNIDDGSALQIESTTGALVIPRMTDVEMGNIVDVLDGAFIFNTTEEKLYTRIDGSWVKYVHDEVATIIFRKTSGNFSLTSTPTLLPINSNNLLYNSVGYYELDGSPSTNGTITVLQDGIYVITAGIAISNLPAGAKKFSLMVYVNGALATHLTNGYVNLPVEGWWGTSGNFPVLLQANDIVEIKYTLDGTGSRNMRHSSIVISKL